MFSRIGSRMLSFLTARPGHAMRIGFAMGCLSPAMPPLSFVTDYNSLEEMSRQGQEPHLVGEKAAQQTAQAYADMQRALRAMQDPLYFDQAVRQLEA